MLLEDVDQLQCAVADTAPLRARLEEKGVRVVSYADWKKIDEAEIAAGAAKGKSRSKFTRVEDMLAVLA